VSRLEEEINRFEEALDTERKVVKLFCSQRETKYILGERRD